MAEYIEKWSVVNRLIELENEFQQYKPFHGFEHAMYRKICEAEIAIGKTQAADVAPVVRCKDCRYSYETFGFLYCTKGVCVDCAVPEKFYCAEGKRRTDDGKTD